MHVLHERHGLLFLIFFLTKWKAWFMGMNLDVL